MTFDAFLQQAWADHGARPEEVARRLDEGYALIETPAQVAPFARLLAHVDGEHLARWSEGVARLERLRAHALWRDDGPGAVVVRRLIAALRLGDGEEAAPGLDAADRAHAHAVVAAALVAQGRLPDAIRHFRAAHAAAAPGLTDGEPAVRALAVASNNLAEALEARPARDADETAVMLDAAGASAEHWVRAGGWLESERAEYMLAKCHLAAGDSAGALAHAEACAAICERSGADAFERAKAAVLAHHETLATDLKPWCEPTLRLLT